jgi:TPR repeat protein
VCAFDHLVRGDALIGLVPDVDAHIARMLAALWRAAEAGEARAFSVLGEVYFAVLVPCGAFDGVAPDPDREYPFSEGARVIEDEELPPLTFALRCWYEAATRGDRAAVTRFAAISRQGPVAAQRLALSLLAALADPAPNEIYLRGLVHTWLDEPTAAAAAHEEAAALGDLDAAFELYVIYAQGLGVEADPDRSRAWLDRAAAGEHPRALYNVAAEHATGRGRVQDLATAASLYRRAAALGNVNAAATLAYMILSGECEGAVDEAQRWLDVADDAGYDTATMLENAGLDDPR